MHLEKGMDVFKWGEADALQSHEPAASEKGKMLEGIYITVEEI